MALFGSDYDDPKTQGLLSLALGMLEASGPQLKPTSFGQVLARGGAAGMGAYQEATARKKSAVLDEINRRLLEARIKETEAQSEERKVNAAKMVSAERMANQRANYLKNLSVPQYPLGTTVVSTDPSKRPENVQPTYPKLDPVTALSLGYKPEEVKAMSEMRDWGRQEVARVVTIDDGSGNKMELPLDKHGDPVGKPMPGYVPPVQVDLGGQVSFHKPQSGLSFTKTPTFSDRVAAGNLALNRERLGLEREKFGWDKDRPQILSVDGVGVFSINKNTGQAVEVLHDGKSIVGLKPLTEAQSKDAGYALRAQQAEKIIIENYKESSPAAINFKAFAEDMPWATGVVPALITHAASSPATQMVEQAQRNFINAILRRESGAVINPSEFVNARKQYFPQPGDLEETKEEKRQNRQAAIAGLLVGGGRAVGNVMDVYKNISGENDWTGGSGSLGGQNQNKGWSARQVK